MSNFLEVLKQYHQEQKPPIEKHNFDRIAYYFERYTEANLGEKYQLGHGIFALYASQLFLLTPHLLHLLRFNFSHYTYNGTTTAIQPEAVTDLLLSAIVRQVFRDTYEIPLAIRTFLEGFYNYILDNKIPELSLPDNTEKIARFELYYSQCLPNIFKTSLPAWQKSMEWNAGLRLNPADTLTDIAKKLKEAATNNSESELRNLTLKIDSLLERVKPETQILTTQTENKTPYSEQLTLLLTYTQTLKKYYLQGFSDEVADAFKALLSSTNQLHGELNAIQLPIPNNIAEKIIPLSPAQQRIQEALLNNADTLDLSNLGLTEIPTEIQELRNLKQLYLYSNQIASLQPLAALTGLQELLLHHNKIQDLTPLARLTKLKKLYLSENAVTDITPLQNLSQLETLYLHSNQIADISPLAKLSHLYTVFLQNNQIKTLQPLLTFIQRTTQTPQISLHAETGHINIAENPLTHPPLEIAAKGNELVRRFFSLPPAIQNLPSNMRLIRGGTFEMGDVFNDNNYGDEKPVHKVSVDDFYMNAYCVTFDEYDAFCKATKRKILDNSGWGRGNRPVINVDWYDAVEYCNWLSQQEGLTPVYIINGDDTSCNWTANGYRLPTEAEWEYAAREGGKKVRFGNGQNILRPTEANFDASAKYKKPYSEVGEYRGKTVPVDSFQPNSLGLYNMSGNVWEWCWDWFDSGYYKVSPAQNPRGPEEGDVRVVRGGSWYIVPNICRVAVRVSYPPGVRNDCIGFRLCRVLVTL